MTGGAKLLALTVSVVMAVGIAALSRLPYTPGDAEDALVRLAWRYRGETESVCRPITDEERARLPVHMQRDTICQASGTPHRLRLVVDGVAAADTLVRAAGARGDRPIYVFHEVLLTAGSHRIEVDFAPEASGGKPAPDGLSLNTTVDLGRRQVALVTYDAATDSLVLRSR